MNFVLINDRNPLFGHEYLVENRVHVWIAANTPAEEIAATVTATVNNDPALLAAYIQALIDNAIEADVKTLMIGNAHMIQWADMIIPLAAYGVATIANKANNPVQTHLGLMYLLNGALADQFDPQRKMLDNFAYTVWMRNLTVFTPGNWLDVRQEVLDALLSPTPSLVICAMAFAAMQPFVSTNAMQMLFPAVTRLIAPQLLEIS